MTDPVHRATLDLLLDLQVPAHMMSTTLRTVIILHHVNTSLKHGYSEVSAYGFMAYGAILARSLKRFDEAYPFGRLALDLNERFGNVDLTCKLHHLFGSFLHFIRPLREALSQFDKAILAGLTSGDFQYMAFAACNAVAIELGLGEELTHCLEKVERFARILAQTGNAGGTLFLQVGRQIIKNLTGATSHRLTLSDASVEERDLAAALERPGFSVAATFYHVVKVVLLFLHGDNEGALEAARNADASSVISEGIAFTIDLSFFACLALAARPLAPPEPAMLAEHRGRLDAWALACPENFLPKKLLVDAEFARVSGDDLAAMALYDSAIEAARKSENVRDEALGSELSARFHLARGRRLIAGAYLSSAHLSYLRWGATAKAEDLARAHPDLIQGQALRPNVRADRQDPLDVATIIRAAQTITQEIVLEQVLSRSMRLVLENAGAQRGVLMLDRNGRLEVEASIRTDPDAVEVGSMGPAEDRADLALSIVQYVARTKTPMVLGDAAREALFSGDAYIVSHRPRSLLCLPLVNQGEIAGVLYLENNVVREAFSPDRIELLRVLSSLSAIAVKNALLYAHVQAVTSELQRTNEGLEAAVALRTEELSIANKRREALHEEIISVQRERLVELAAPLMPIADRIMVMPLLGRMDLDRAQQVLEVGLAGAYTNQTRFMILDITGMRVADASVASLLLRMAGALGLLGTRVVITGVRPQMARAFVELDIELGALVTRSTLESGIAYALAQHGRSR